MEPAPAPAAPMPPVDPKAQKVRETLEAEYFACAKPSEFGARLFGKLGAAGSFGRSSEQLINWRQAYLHSYASIEMGAGRASMVLAAGDEGELSAVRINRSRAVQRSLVGLLMGPQIAWRPQARNGDPASRRAIRKAANLLEYFWKQRHVNQAVTRWVDQGTRYGEAYVFAPWDWMRGPDGGPAGQKLGDLAFHNVLPWHVFGDEGYANAEDRPWLAAQLFMNKHDVLAHWPEDINGESTIGRITAAAAEVGKYSDGTGMQKGSDVVPVLFWFHKKTGAVLNGRSAVVVNSSTVLQLDEELKYNELPILRFAPEELDDTPRGYTSYFDALGIQEESDGIESSIASNLLTFSDQSVVMTEGMRAAPDDVRGLKVFYKRRGDDDPKALQLASVPPDAFAHLDRLETAQRNMLGLTDISMGDPKTADMNAAAFQILQGAANQRSAPLQETVTACVAKLGSHVIDTLNRNLGEERTFAIAGKSAMESVSVKPGELKPVEEVIIGIGSALEQSVPGRVTLAQMFLDNGMAKSPEQLQQVLETGRLEPVTDPLRSAMALIDSENESLEAGETPQALFLDDAIQHCVRHWAVLNDNPASRQQPEVIQATLAHIHQHYALYFGLPDMPPPPGSPPGTPPVPPNPMADPQYPVRIRLLLGQTPPPSMMPAPPPGAPPGHGGPPPPHGGGNPSDVLAVPSPT